MAQRFLVLGGAVTDVVTNLSATNEVEVGVDLVRLYEGKVNLRYSAEGRERNKKRETQKRAITV